jgi:hypothetical protein
MRGEVVLRDLQIALPRQRQDRDPHLLEMGQAILYLPRMLSPPAGDVLYLTLDQRVRI